MRALVLAFLTVSAFAASPASAQAWGQPHPQNVGYYRPGPDVAYPGPHVRPPRFVHPPGHWRRWGRPHQPHAIPPRYGYNPNYAAPGWERPRFRGRGWND